jgi:hypothetical protein
VNAPKPLSARAALRLNVVFFASTTVERDGRRFAGPEAKFRTFSAARRWLDAQGMPGNVTVWSARTQTRDAVGTRSAEGAWTVRDARGEFAPFASDSGCPNLRPQTGS